MREILFRGKCLTTGEWTYGYLLADTADCKMKKRGECVCPHDGSVAYILTWVDEFHEYGYVEIDPATVGQYTGLEDKNGKKVFEGDILWLEDTRANYGWYGRVEFGNPNGEYNWGFQLVHLEGPLPNVDILLWFDMEECGVFAEIVDNIHDRP